MKEWKEYRIQDIADFQKGFAFKSSDYSESGTRIIKVTNLNQKDYNNCAYIDNSEAPLYDKYRLAENDIIISTVGSWPTNPESVVGKVSRIPECISGSLLNQNAVRIKVRNGFCQNFLYYHLLTPAFAKYIVGTAQGSANQASITLDDIRHYSFLCPDYQEQVRLSSILQAIDDKIDLNNRINHNLEEQADCLLSSAIETQANGSAHLRDICSYVSGKVNCDTLINENYISTDNMFANRGGVGIASTIPEGKCTSFMARDILVSNIRPYFKKVWRASFSGGCSNDVLCFRSTTGTSSFLYHLIRSDAFFDYVMSGAKGSKMPRGDKQHIMNWEIPLFENGFIASLEDSLKVIDDRVAIIQEENRRLNDIRDSLLPMLMNNRVSINGLTC